MRCTPFWYDTAGFHVSQILIRRGSSMSMGVVSCIQSILILKDSTSMKLRLSSLLCRHRLYLLPAFPRLSVIFGVFIGFLSILLRNSTSQLNFCGCCWSFLIVETIFSISSWIVAKQPLEAHTIKFLQLRPSETKRNSSNLLITIWQWTRKRDNELGSPWICWEGGLLVKLSS